MVRLEKKGRNEMSLHQQPNRLTRGQFLRGATGTVAAAVAGPSLSGFPAAAGVGTSSRAATSGPSDSDLAELEAKIRAGMQAYGIPGVAVGLIRGSTTFIRGYGVTNVDYPVPVDGDTLFRIGSTTKTFTGTTAMRLVDRGDLDLDAKLRKYLPHFRTSQPQEIGRASCRERV